MAVPRSRAPPVPAKTTTEPVMADASAPEHRRIMEKKRLCRQQMKQQLCAEQDKVSRLKAELEEERDMASKALEAALRRGRLIGVLVGACLASSTLFFSSLLPDATPALALQAPTAPRPSLECSAMNDSCPDSCFLQSSKSSTAEFCQSFEEILADTVFLLSLWRYLAIGAAVLVSLLALLLLRSRQQSTSQSKNKGTVMEETRTPLLSDRMQPCTTAAPDSSASVGSRAEAVEQDHKEEDQHQKTEQRRQAGQQTTEMQQQQHRDKEQTARNHHHQTPDQQPMANDTDSPKDQDNETDDDVDDLDSEGSFEEVVEASAHCSLCAPYPNKDLSCEHLYHFHCLTAFQEFCHEQGKTASCPICAEKAPSKPSGRATGANNGYSWSLGDVLR